MERDEKILLIWVEVLAVCAYLLAMHALRAARNAESLAIDASVNSMYAERMARFAVRSANDRATTRATVDSPSAPPFVGRAEQPHDAPPVAE